jgi:hypothetical protein
VHFIKERKIYMPDADPGLQVPGEPAGNLPGDPILAKGSLNKYPCRYYKEQQQSKEPQNYFFKSLQVQGFSL